MVWVNYVDSQEPKEGKWINCKMWGIKKVTGMMEKKEARDWYLFNLGESSIYITFSEADAD